MQIRLVYDHASSAPQRLDFRISYDDSQTSQIDFLHFPHCADVDPHLAVLLKRDNWYVAVSQCLCLAAALSLLSSELKIPRSILMLILRFCLLSSISPCASLNIFSFSVFQTLLFCNLVLCMLVHR